MQLDDFVLYLDENLQNCKPILDALAASQVRFERHEAHFQRGEEDEVWLPQVADWGWIVLTKDKRNRYNDVERAAVRRHRVREFYFSAGNMNGAEMAQALVAALPKMREIINQYESPIVGSITRAGAVTVLYDREGSTHERRKAKAAKAADDV
ncbi:MAG: hypothetical protein ACHP7P_12835 [Terriglobales bacterium]